jgi:hypothetical protein
MSDDTPECAICQETLRGCATAAPECGHAFHVHCLDSWLARGAASCPTCRHATPAATALSPSSFAHLARLVAAPPPHLAAKTPTPPEKDGAPAESAERAHVLVASDVSFDDLCAQKYTDGEVAALRLSIDEALRLGLRSAHFDGWLDAERAHILFRGTTWRHLRDLGIAFGDARLSAHALGRLGLTARSLRLAGELTRERLLALPYTLEQWCAELRLERTDIDALLLRRDDFAALQRAERGWSLSQMTFLLRYTNEDFVNLGLMPDYSKVVLQL